MYKQHPTRSDRMNRTAVPRTDAAAAPSGAGNASIGDWQRTPEERSLICALIGGHPDRKIRTAGTQDKPSGMTTITYL